MWSKVAVCLVAAMCAAPISSSAEPAAPTNDPAAAAEGVMCRAPQSGDNRIQIAGGQDAAAADYPFIVHVDISGGFCGGALIAPGFVLTAAHCVMPSPAGFGCVADGPGRCKTTPAAAVRVSRPTAGGLPAGETRGVKALFAHPKFRYPTRADDRGALDADVAILVLDEPFNLGPGDAVRMAGEAFDRSYAVGGACARTAGWGATYALDSGLRQISAGEPRSDKLQALNLALVDQEACAQTYDPLITGNMICAGDGVEGFNTCKGDSGGPLVLDVGTPVLVGLVSWSFGCAQAEHFTIFTRIGAPDVRGWVLETLRGGQ